ncbi:hypothetical protein Hypma_010357 [Hypsizygus marmoreus]|uniref:AB hydrolase-1 domain-containing protein n=1 Tax=Hypsizygus marmoreus TaxID=39966 RepID=A0A369JQ10_HYPMA|nr:hypothetical protein Hypma_010357 [Hypsizygus marmoreus]
MIHVEDKTLALPDGRFLAYADNGNTSSSSVVLYLHGGFSVGDASRLPRVLAEKTIHFVAPSLPGWGKSSPIIHAAAPPASYATTLAADITALITHLHPNTTSLRLYICSHSFGTVPAQILYGLPHDVFPLGRQIAALVLLAPLSPPHCHKAYAKKMTWQAYLTSGPPARYIPFNLVMRVLSVCMATQFAKESSAEAVIRNSMASTMVEEEREMFAPWREEHGVGEGQFEREMGKNVVRSVAQTWQGFLDMPTIYHSGWGGFDPQNIATSCPVLVVDSTDDDMAPTAMAQWLADTYKSAELKSIPGSHLSSFFYLEDIWERVFELESSFTAVN